MFPLHESDTVECPECAGEKGFVDVDPDSGIENYDECLTCSGRGWLYTYEAHELADENRADEDWGE